MSATPLVSVILTTRDRPRFLPLALACYRHQSYPRKELIVVDDGETDPASAYAVEQAGGKLIRMASGTSIGAKLNRGMGEARGDWCQKMDDDDWYAPDFLTNMVAGVTEKRADVCRPFVAFVAPFLFFDVPAWEIRRSVVNNLPGATLFFARSDWEERPFRDLTNDEDLWFVLDQCRMGRSALPLRNTDCFLAVRHKGTRGDRGHTWVDQSDGRQLEDYLTGRPLYKDPETLLPEWALTTYREIRRQATAPR